MTATAIEARTAHAVPQSSARSVMLHMIPNIIVSGVLPFVLYQALKGHGVATVPALCAGAIFPGGSTLLHWLRTRQADVIGIMTLVFLIVPVTMSLISDNARFVLSKDSFVTGLSGLLFLGSLLTARPMVFYLYRQFTTGGDPERIAGYNAQWQNARFRHGIATMTATWGVVLLVEAMVRIALVFVPPVPVFLVASQVLVYAVLSVMIPWSMRYSRRLPQRGAVAA